MNRPGEGVARFFELRGSKVVEAHGRFWYRYAGPCYMSLPHHLTLDVEPAEVARSLGKAGCVAARYPSTSVTGVPAGTYAMRDRSYGLHSLDPRMRRYVRRGLDRLEIREVSHDELAAGGLACNLDTMKRQRRWDRDLGDPARWRKLVGCVYRAPGFRVFGAFADARLATYTVCYRDGAWLHTLYRNTLAALDDLRAPHTLLYSMFRGAMSDPSIEAVSDGVVPMDPRGGLHEWKLRMGYAVEPCNTVFAVHAALRPVFRGLGGVAALRMLRRLRPADARVERLALAVQSAFACIGAEALQL